MNLDPVGLACAVLLAALLGLYARRVSDTLTALLAEQRTTNELLREQVHAATLYRSPR